MPKGRASASLKQRLYAGERAFGAWIGTGSVTVAEIMAGSGFDFLVVDLEHGQEQVPFGLDMIRAVQASPAACVVRVPSSDPVYIKRILDAGVDGIMIPSVETAEEARTAVAACRYPPHGIRGYAAPNVRASGYGLHESYLADVDADLLVILQIESAAAVEEADAICAIEGVDVAFIGVNDLGGSIGRLERLSEPEVRALVSRAEDAMRASGKIMGTVPSSGATWQELFDAGYRFVPLAADVALLRASAGAVVSQVSAVIDRR